VYTRILTELERRRINRFLRQDGEKDVAIRKIVNRGRTNLPKIREDLELLEHLLEAYSEERVR
jgi:hypothetical protein